MITKKNQGVNFLLALSLVAAPKCFGQTSGPVQTEYQAYGSSQVSEMVDPFTGDLNYNIPLFKLVGPNGSFPFALNYNSNVSLTDEASWVGLGWGFSPGAITRQLRGIPDDHNQATITETRSIKSKLNYGGGLAGGFEIYGLGLTGGLGVYYNNYQGMGMTRSMGLNYSYRGNISASTGISVSVDSQQGTSATPSLSLSAGASKGNFSAGIGGTFTATINSRAGLTEADLNVRGNVNYNYASLLALVPRDILSRSNHRPMQSLLSGGKTVWSYSSPAYSPAANFPMDGMRIVGSFRYGASIWGGYGNITLNGHFSKQWIDTDPLALPSYGYLYLQNGTSLNAINDFDREKDGTVRKETPNLAAPIISPDLFAVNGHNVSGMFRAFRPNYGVLQTNKVESTMTSVSTGGEIGAGGIAHFGADFTGFVTTDNNQVWHDTDVDSYYDWKGWNAGKFNEEPYYWKFIGEINVATDTLMGAFKYPRKDNNYTALPGGLPPMMSVPSLMGGKFYDEMNDIGGEDPVRIQIGNITEDLPIGNADSWLQSPRQSYPIRKNRLAKAVRRTLIQSFTYSDLVNGADAHPLFNFTYIDKSGNEKSSNSLYADRLNAGLAKPDELAGFIITGEDGSRNVYGIPVLNRSQTDYTFSADPVSTCKPILSNITSYTDIGDEFKSIKVYPPYSIAFLLTAVVGPDYVDADLTPGSSDQDLGHHVELKYKLAEDNFVWRAPYRGASYNRGFLNHDNGLVDDRKFYTVGVKELWYVASAETSIQRANFFTSIRQDGRGADSDPVNGTAFTGVSQKLDSVIVYSKADLTKPLQTISFNYTYELTEGIPNFQSNSEKFKETVVIDNVKKTTADDVPGTGKLTLKNLNITFESSKRGKLNPYHFSYGNNKPYQYGAQDRWGKYKDVNYDDCDAVGFPYTDQYHPITVNDNSAAWLLSAIDLPSGGRISIDFESDSYSYVQNRRAAFMANVTGYDPGQRKIYFKFLKPIPDDASKNAELAKYFAGFSKLYFRVKVNLKSTVSELVTGYPPADQKEYVAGYGTIDTYDFDSKNSAGDYVDGWVKLKPVKLDGTDFNPISLSAWQHLRLNQPYLLSKPPFTPNPDGSLATEILKIATLTEEFMDTANGLAELFQGFNGTAKRRQWGEEMDTTHSYIRLTVPNGVKLGGGARVKKFQFNNNWKASTSDSEADDSFGFVYSYNNPDGSSSGVASYEPSVGGDENPMRVPKAYTHDLEFASSYSLFFEEPVNESLFPGAQIGYGYVRVMSLTADKIVNSKSLDAAYTSTGATDHEYYTAKDFPVRVRETLVDRDDVNDSKFRLGFGDEKISTAAFSQGYSIILNNMHGQKKATRSYALKPNGEVETTSYRSTEYRYQSTIQHQADGSVEYDLDNVAQVLIPNYLADSAAIIETSIVPRIVGRDFDFYVDMRSDETWTEGGGANANVDVLPTVPVTIPIPTVWPTIGTELTDTKMAVANKIIQKYGIISEVIETNYGSVVTTKNMLIDGYTGNSLLKISETPYGDTLWHYQTPAYWRHMGMGLAFRNTGITFTPVLSGQGVKKVNIPISGDALFNVLASGDEFAVKDGSKQIHGWITNMDITTRSIELTFATATDFSGQATPMMLIRSGRRNLVHEQSANIASLRNPLLRKIITCTTTRFYPCAVTKKKTSFARPTKDFSLFFRDIPSYAVLAVSKKARVNFKYKTPGSNPSLNCYRVDPDRIRFKEKKGKAEQSLMFYNAQGQALPISSLKDVSGLAYDSIKPASVASVGKYQTKYTGLAFAAKDGDKAYIFATFEGLIDKGSKFLPDFKFCHEYLPVARTTIDSVLSISRLVYEDYWPADTTEISFMSTAVGPNLKKHLLELNPYANGSKGIWKLKDRYNYLTDRAQDGAQPVTRRDGSFSGVVFNDWNSLKNFECDTHWVKSESVTNYSAQSHALERVRPGEIPEANLISYRNTLNTAYSVGSTFRTLGFESFDEYEAGKTVNHTNIGNGNIDFFTKTLIEVDYMTTTLDLRVVYCNDDFLAIDPRAAIAGVEKFFSAKQNATNDFVIRSMSFQPDCRVMSGGGPMEMGGGQMGAAANGDMYIGFDQPIVDRCFGGGMRPEISPGRIPVDLGKPSSCIKEGRIKIVIDEIISRVPLISIESFAEIAGNKAHTGKNSLLISQPISYKQNRLRLTPGQQYNISAWVSRTEDRVYDYADAARPAGTPKIIVRFLDLSWRDIGSFVLEPSGQVLDGWQKMDSTFAVPQGAYRISLDFDNGTAADNKPLNAYFDDIRIHPRGSSMESYVYDRKNQRMVAKLDENNYATFFGFDPDSKLRYVNKETTGGRVTLKEFRNNLIKK